MKQAAYLDREFGVPRALPETQQVAVLGMALCIAGSDTLDAFWQRTLTGAQYNSNGTDQGSNGLQQLIRTISASLSEVRRDPAERYCLFVAGGEIDSTAEERYVAAALERRFNHALERRLSNKQDQDALRSVLGRPLPRTGASLDQTGHLRDALGDLWPKSAPIIAIDAACGSSLYAIDIAVKYLLSGRCDVAVCASASVVSKTQRHLLSKLGALSAGSPHPFDERSDGMLQGAGAAAVVLKRLQAAGSDTVHGVVAAFGPAASGKGKAMHAASRDGQRLSLQRALRAGAPVQWVLAHANGSPVGDRIELDNIWTELAAEQPWVTSNKAVLGQLGAASGMVSLIQAMLSFQHERIPPQQRFPTTLSAAESVRIPAVEQSFPRDGTQRRVLIAAHGFGGVNAHLLVADRPDACVAVPVKRSDERISIAGWVTQIPGIRAGTDVPAWLRGELGELPASFGERYPTSPCDQLRLPPRTIRRLDRTQLIILDCARQLSSTIAPLLQARREKTGVIIGHTGRTHQAVLQAERLHLDAVHRSICNDAPPAQQPLLSAILENVREELERAAPSANEDTLTGCMPNVIAGRLAAALDVKGLAFACDAGLASSLLAIELAAHYLLTYELDVAIVGGVNGNSASEARAFGCDLGAPAQVAEGAVLFVLSRESLLQETGIPSLAFVYGAQPAARASTVPVFDCERSLGALDQPSYLAADGAIALLRALHADTEVALVRARGITPADDRCLRLEWPRGAPNAGIPRRAGAVDERVFAS